MMDGRLYQPELLALGRRTPHVHESFPQSPRGNIFESTFRDIEPEDSREPVVNAGGSGVVYGNWAGSNRWKIADCSPP